MIRFALKNRSVYNKRKVKSIRTHVVISGWKCESGKQKNLQWKMWKVVADDWEYFHLQSNCNTNVLSFMNCMPSVPLPNLKASGITYIWISYIMFICILSSSLINSAIHVNSDGNMTMHMYHMFLIAQHRQTMQSKFVGQIAKDFFYWFVCFTSHWFRLPPVIFDANAQRDNQRMNESR